MQKKPLVSIIMGSSSDLPIMADAARIMEEFEISFELTAISAHRAPDRMLEFAKNITDRGVKIVIAGASGAAHLPGMLAALTRIPIIGVPLKSSISLDGWDSILSILQMPGGVPVATVGLNGAKNAGLLAVRILAVSDASLGQKMSQYILVQRDKVIITATELEQKGYQEYLKQ